MSQDNLLVSSTPSASPVGSGNGTRSESHGNSSVSISPLRTAETFDAYCSQVQARLAHHAVQRRHFLQEAYERLTRLFQAARDMEDTVLCNELWQHRQATRELLDALSRYSPTPETLSPTPLPNAPANGHSSVTSSPVAFPSEPGRESAIVNAAVSDVRSISSSTPLNEALSSLSSLGTAPAPTQAVTTSPPAPRLPRQPMRPLVEIEADAAQQREFLRQWNEQYPLVTDSGELNAPNCLRLRALACRQRRLEAEAGDTEVAEVTELANDIVALLDAADDQEYTVALDYELEPRPTAYQWGEMAERYEEMARAQEAFEWWNRHLHRLSVADVQPMVEAVAAIQQRFNRLLFRVGSRDPFQQQLFDELRVWAREAQCYLHSLRPKVPIQELVERAATLENAREQAERALQGLESPLSEAFEQQASPEISSEASVPVEEQA